jgi:hypothetical protein
MYGEALNTLKRTQQLPGGAVSSRARVYGNEWMVQTGLGAQLAPKASDWSLLVTGRLAGAGSRQGGVREAGAGAFDIQTYARTSGTVLSKAGIEGAKEWSMAGLPFRMSGSLEWLHDFNVEPRRLAVRWSGAGSEPWSVRGSRGQADVVKAGLSFEVGLSEVTTLRAYAEQHFLRQGPATQFGVSYSVGF